jgi:hypothetical protein
MTARRALRVAVALFAAGSLFGSSLTAAAFTPYGGPLGEGENGVIVTPSPDGSKDDLPLEGMTLNFGTITFSFQEQNEKSTAKSGVPMHWEVSENAGKK